MAQQNGFGREAARPALGALFRQRQPREFMRAWESLPFRDDAAVDMLWHVMGPGLNAVEDEETLTQLQGAIRRPQAFVDLERLAPRLARTFGSAHVRGVIQRELEQADKPRERKELQKLLQQY